MLEWSVEDSNVASITDGVLHGENNGSTTISCGIGDFNDIDQVTVEISPSPYLFQAWSGWTFKGAGAKNIAIDEMTGDITFDYSSNRAPYLQMSKELALYSLPDTVGITFNASIPIEYVQVDIRNRYNTTSNFLRIDPEGSETFAPGEDHTIVIDLDALGGAGNVGTFPLTVKSIKFTINKEAEAGNHCIAMKSFYCHYPHTSEQPGLTGDVNGDGEVNIADVNAIIDVILMGAANADADVNRDGEVNIADINAIIDLILAK